MLCTNTHWWRDLIILCVRGNVSICLLCGPSLCSSERTCLEGELCGPLVRAVAAEVRSAWENRVTVTGHGRDRSYSSLLSGLLACGCRSPLALLSAELVAWSQMGPPHSVCLWDRSCFLSLSWAHWTQTWPSRPPSPARCAFALAVLW